MPRHKSLLLTSHVKIAGRLRKCYHCGKGKIAKGDKVLEVKVGMAIHGYCEKCARAMISMARAKLTELEKS